MRTSSTVTCRSCDAAWDPDHARFCGGCGARLQAAPPAEPAMARPRLRLAVWLVAAIAVAGGAFAVAGTGTLRLPQRGADPAVELDPDELTVEGEPLSDAQRAEALAPFDPDRLRCEPEGCERWRIDLPDDGGARVFAAVVDDLVVAVAGDEVRGYDLHSGDERWRAAWPDASDPPPGTDVALVQPGGDDGVIATWPVSGHVHALDTRGRTRWHAVEPSGGRGFVSAHGDVVVVSEPTGEELEIELDVDGDEVTTHIRFDDLRVLDAATGEPLWEARSVSLRALADGAFLAFDGATTHLLDARTGEVIAQRDLPAAGGWVRPAGDVLLYEEQPWAGTWQLLAGDTLEVVAEVGPLDSLMPTQDRSVLIGQARGGRDTGDRILAFELDGTLRWEHELSLPAGSLARCCARVDGDVLLLPPPAGTTTPLRLDLADGSAMAVPPTRPGAVPAPADGPGTRWMSPHTAVILDPTGDTDGVIWHDGSRMRVRGQFDGPHNAETPLVFTGNGSILAVQPVPRD